MTHPQLALFARKVSSLQGAVRVSVKHATNDVGEFGADQPDLAEALQLLATDYVTAQGRTVQLTFRAEGESGQVLRAIGVRFFHDVEVDGVQTTVDVVRMLASHNHQYAQLILAERQQFQESMQALLDRQQRFFSESMDRLIARVDSSERERDAATQLARDAVGVAEDARADQKRKSVGDRLEGLIGQWVETNGLTLLPGGKGGAGDAAKAANDSPAEPATDEKAGGE